MIYVAVPPSHLQAAMPELPSAKRERYVALGLPMYDVLILSDDVATAQLFDAVLAAGVSPKTASNWILGDVMAYCNVSGTVLEGERGALQCERVRAS